MSGQCEEFTPSKGKEGYYAKDLRRFAVAAGIETTKKDTKGNSKPLTKDELFEELRRSRCKATKPASPACRPLDWCSPAACSATPKQCAAETPTAGDTCHNRPLKFTSEQTPSSAACDDDEELGVTKLKKDEALHVLDWAKTIRGGASLSLVKKYIYGTKSKEAMTSVNDMLDCADSVRLHHTLYPCAKVHNKLTYIPPLDLWLKFGTALYKFVIKCLYTKEANTSEAILVLKHVVSTLRCVERWRSDDCAQLVALDILEPQLAKFMELVDEVHRLPQDPHTVLAKVAAWRAPSHEVLRLHGLLRHTALALLAAQVQEKCGDLVSVDIDGMHLLGVQQHLVAHMDKTVEDPCRNCTKVHKGKPVDDEALKEYKAMIWLSQLPNHPLAQYSLKRGHIQVTELFRRAFKSKEFNVKFYSADVALTECKELADPNMPTPRPFTRNALQQLQDAMQHEPTNETTYSDMAEAAARAVRVMYALTNFVTTNSDIADFSEANYDEETVLENVKEAVALYKYYKTYKRQKEWAALTERNRDAFTEWFEQLHGLLKQMERSIVYARKGKKSPTGVGKKIVKTAALQRSQTKKFARVSLKGFFDAALRLFAPNAAQSVDLKTSKDAWELVEKQKLAEGAIVTDKDVESVKEMLKDFFSYTGGALADVMKSMETGGPQDRAANNTAALQLLDDEAYAIGVARKVMDAEPQTQAQPGANFETEIDDIMTKVRSGTPFNFQRHSSTLAHPVGSITWGEEVWQMRHVAPYKTSSGALRFMAMLGTEQPYYTYHVKFLRDDLSKVYLVPFNTARNWNANSPRYEKGLPRHLRNNLVDTVSLDVTPTP